MSQVWPKARFLLCLSIWTIANGVTKSLIQLAVFRALQGIGAAATMPSSVGIISSYFWPRIGCVGSRCLTSLVPLASASGSSSWFPDLKFLLARYLFYLRCFSLAALGTRVVCTSERLAEGTRKAETGLLEAGLSTNGLILLSFVLSRAESMAEVRASSSPY